MKKIFTMNLADDKADVVKDICKALGAEYAVLDSGCGHLRVADIIDGVSDLKPGDGDRKLSMEMAVFAGITSRELDIFLDRYRKSGAAPIALKSIVTETNREWTVEKLYSELAREYLFYKMRGK